MRCHCIDIISFIKKVTKLKVDVEIKQNKHITCYSYVNKLSLSYDFLRI